MSYDKPFKNHSEQLEILKSRGLDIENSKHSEMTLSNYSYYTLINGFKNALIDDKENYIPGTKLSDLKKLYFIDIELNSIFLKNTIIFERIFKTKLAYYISEHYGVWTDYNNNSTFGNPDDYLDESHYTGNRSSNIIKKIKKEIIDSINSTTEYYKNSKNHIPPWVLVNDISFGLSIEWFRLLSKHDKLSIIHQFISNQFNNINNEELIDLFVTLVIYLRDFRNVTAHGNRTFSSLISTNIKLNLINKLLGVELQNSYPCINNNCIFTLITCLTLLINDEDAFKQIATDINIFKLKHKDFRAANKNIYELLEFDESIDKYIIYIAKIK